MLAALLALASSFCYGSSDFIAGLQSRRRSVWSVLAVSQPAALLVAGGLVVVLGSPLTRPGALLVALLGGLALAAAAVLYYHALSSGTMSVVAPIANAGVLVPVLVGLASGESLRTLQYVGMTLAIAGIVLSSRVEARNEGHTSLRSVLYAVGSATCFGVVMLALTFGGREDVYWSVFGVRLGATGAILAYVVLRRPRLEVPRRTLPAFVAVGVLAMLANVLYTAATTIGYLSVVSVLASLSPVVVAVLAGGMLHERLSRAQLSAALVVLVGVVLLAAG
ncbi:MAG: DMT family transporter [Thermoleophilia bacterium]|nr:DMT family transporter [Thermoleophilia bacterium]